MVQDDRSCLFRGERRERPDQIDRIHAELGHDVTEERLVPAPALELTPGYAERSPPDPAVDITDRRSSSERLREGLREGIARDLGVAREQQQGTPEPLALGAERSLYLVGHGRDLAHPPV